MMGIKERIFRPLPNLSLEELVPQENFYRHLERTLDLSFVRELVKDCYASCGRPSVDPVVFFRLQLVMFFEGIRSERQLMEVAADRLSVRWYLGYDLHESVPDHSSLTKIRERYGLEVFRRFFERIVEECFEAGLVWGKELYFDATKVEANASLESIAPRFAVEAHLEELFEEENATDPRSGARRAAQEAHLEDVALPSATDKQLATENASKSDWISRDGRQQREMKGEWYRRTADLLASKTDPDASPMKRKGKDFSHLGYHAHYYVVDGGKSRVILGVLVTPFEVTENKPMLDLLWRSVFRWKVRPERVTGDSAYGTVENISAVEKVGIRAYMSLKGAGKGRPYFSKDEFTYDAKADLYRCPAGQSLRPAGRHAARSLIKYRADAGTCGACALKPKCTLSKKGREVLRYLDEEYVDRVKGYSGTYLYEKALRKRRVWVEPLFGEAKDWHGLRRFRLRRLEKVNVEALLIASGQNVKRLLGANRCGLRSLPQATALHPAEPTRLVHRGRRLVRPHRRRPRRTIQRVFQRADQLLAPLRHVGHTSYP
jgi:transposase